MNDIYDLVDDEKNMLSEFGDIILKGAALDLSKTKLEVDTNVTIGAGINLMSPWCFTINLGFWKKKICTKGLGASVNVGVDGSMDVYPELRLLNGAKASDQTISIADMISTFSSSRERSLFKTTASGRTNSNQKQLNASENNTTTDDSDGKEGTIRSVLTDYTAHVEFDFAGYINQIDPNTTDPAHVQIRVNLDNSLFVNIKTNEVSLLDDGSKYTIEIADTGWISSRDSVLSMLGNTSTNTETVQYFKLNDRFYLGQIAKNLQAKLQEFLVQEFPEHAVSDNPLLSLLKEIKPELNDPRSIRNEVNTITNNILSMATAGGLDIALAEKQSLLISTGKAPRDTSNDPKVYVNGVEEEIPQAEEQSTSEYLSFAKHHSTSNTNDPNIVFGYKPIVTKQASDVKATFKLLTNDTEFGSNIQVYIVDKNSDNIANLGTISEVTNDTLSSSVSEGGDSYEEGDADKEGERGRGSERGREREVQ